MSDDEKLVVLGDAVLHRGDLKLLGPGEWLNDRLMTFIIEYYYRMLDEDKQKRICIMHAPEVEIIKFGDSTDELAAVFSALELGMKDLVLFVVNDNQDPSVEGGSHWFLLLFSRMDNRFYYMDSIQNKSLAIASRVCQNIIPLLDIELDEESSTIELQAPIVAQQENMSDCGLYVVEFAKRIFEEGVVSVRDMDFPPSLIVTRRKFLLEKIVEMANQQA